MSAVIFQCKYVPIGGGRELAEFLADRLYNPEPITTYLIPEDLEEAEDMELFDNCPEDLKDEVKALIEEFGGSEITISWQRERRRG